MEKYYHFTAKHLADSCAKQGLTRGHIVVPSRVAPQAFIGQTGVRLVPGYQWLTKNPEREQEWCNPEFSTLPYRRNAVRFTVEIPKHDRHKLIPSERVQGFRELGFGEYGDPENWFAFQGDVDPTWLIERVDFLPTENLGSGDADG